jgi:signal peptidase I
MRLKRLKSILGGWVIPVAIAFVLAMLIKQFLFFNINVPTASMFPTIKPGDRILVTRVYNKNKLKRGDIVVFHSKELKEDLIKRLIGVPNDTVVISEDGKVTVNGTLLKENYVVYNGGKGGSYKVPADSYFFLGDNRGDSKDSRYWDTPYINKKDIMGVARVILYPFKRFGELK